ncbi:hypothetical protein Cgig2_013890 [Carnegiea gigantea]|uniref:Vesicle-associated membrane protein 714 n=1 Tax=Carnegiea gigantea TaxID=171969 RepID=A0A9Q1GKW7_9CARY|nr:hypothetical protein Cgig2_013890 [Carnegiea gigantea]
MLLSAVTGNAGAVARRILEKLPSEADSRLCFSQDRYIFHILKADDLTFLCMANDTFGRRIPFSYLEDIHMRFMKNYGRIAQHAPAYAMNDEFSRVLHQQMEFYSSSPSADTINRVRGEIRTIMVENIEKILDRGDKIELLVDKTATMQDSAFHFRKQSKRLRRAIWLKNDMADLLACRAPLHHNCCFLWRPHSSTLQILISNSGSLFLSLMDSCGAICLFILEKLMSDPVWSYCEGVFGESISMVPLSSHFL